MASAATLPTLRAPDWQDYELLDCGAGEKLERFGPYTLIRPEAPAAWHPALPRSTWEAAHARFEPSGSQGGQWIVRRDMEDSWVVAYRNLRCRVQARESRQVGVFPENAAHWDWLAGLLTAAGRPAHVLSLFGYTGLATLAAAQAGARVTHVDASRKAVAWARENQALSGLVDRPVRWIVDDALAYVRREARRGVLYDGVVMDPPAFGRGPHGQVWSFSELFRVLCRACAAALSRSPLFVVVTVYTRSASPATLEQGISEMVAGLDGRLSVGQLATVERSAGRVLPNALFARWQV